MSPSRPQPASTLSGPADFDWLIAETSARLLSGPSADVRGVIHSAIEDIRRVFRADRCGLLEVSADERHCGIYCAAYAEGLPRLPETVNFIQLHPWAARRLIRERLPVHFSRFEDLPPEAATDLPVWQHQGVRSTVGVPLVVGGRVSHIMVMDSIFEERVWPASSIPPLKILGELIASAALRLEAFEALRVSEERLTRAAAASGTALWDLDTDGGQIWLTAQARIMYGIGPDEPATFERFVALLHEDDREQVIAALAAAMRDGAPLVADYRIVLPDGNERWIHVVGRPSGTRLLGASVDITTRMQADQQLRLEAARVTAAVDVAGLGFSDMAIGAPPFIDERLREMLGLSPGDEAHMPAVWFDRIAPEQREEVRELRRQILAGDIDRVNFECRYAHPTRGWIWLRHATRRMRREPWGDQVHLIGATEDITERRNREESMKAAEQVVRDRLEGENLYLRREVSASAHTPLVSGRSAAIRRALDLAGQVAETSSTVLLLGETGTGKERFAQYIHEASPRRRHHMVRVNCSAIPAALIESELFGREKGAYTGAMSRQVGRFELAHGSTLFLDEIGDLPVDVQVRLLRVLQERTLERLGSPTPITVDVRVIAATNRDLEASVRNGTFRADLYYRLNVFPITLPPLRERLEDLPALLDVLVEDLGSSIRKRFDAVDRASVAALERYGWPGNVRELRNVLERAMILGSGPTLTVLPPEQAGPVAPDVTAPSPARTPEPAAAPAPASDAISDVERAHILQILEQTGWRIRGPRAAAALLGLKPTTLEARMRRLGLQRPGG